MCNSQTFAELQEALETLKRTPGNGPSSLKLVQNAFFSITWSLFEDAEGKLWEFTQQSDGKYQWFPILEDEREDWADHLSEVFLLSDQVGNLRTGRAGLPLLTHEKRREEE